MIAHVNLKGEHCEKSEWLKDMFKYRRFAIMFTLTNALWFARNFAYTGGIAFAAISSDNPYMMMTINSIIDVAAAVAANYLGGKLGRKSATIVPCATSAILYLIGAFLDPERCHSFLCVVMVARLALTIGYNVQYLYAAEIHPTSIRARAYSVRMSAGSLGNLLAPQASGSAHARNFVQA